MQQTRKDNQWDFEMKMNIGIDDVPGLFHTEMTLTNMSDIESAEDPLHIKEECVLSPIREPPPSSAGETFAV